MIIIKIIKQLQGIEKYNLIIAMLNVDMVTISLPPQLKK